MDSLCLSPFFMCISKLFESLVEFKIQIENRLLYLDVYDDDCILPGSSATTSLIICSEISSA